MMVYELSQALLSAVIAPGTGISKPIPDPRAVQLLLESAVSIARNCGHAVCVPEELYIPHDPLDWELARDESEDVIRDAADSIEDDGNRAFADSIRRALSVLTS